MTGSHPPRLAAALLRRAFDADDPLVGDLLEGFEHHPSRVWFWRQTLSAIAFSARRERDQEHPLGLAPPSHGFVTPARTGATRRTINLSASPSLHVGGIGLVAFVTLTAVVRPQAWWMLLPVLAGGIIIAVVMAIAHRPRA